MTLKMISKKRAFLDKNFVKSKEIKQNWTRPENFDIRFYVSFGR